MANILLGLAVACFVIGGGLAMFHVVAYRRLCSSLQARGLPVSDLYLEGFDYGSRGCVGKLKVIAARLQEAKTDLTPAERVLFRRSKRFYYIGGVMAVPCAIALFALYVWTSTS